LRRFAALVALAVFAVLALVAFGAGSAAADPARPLLVIAVPDLQWTDVPHVPVVKAFADLAGVGVMSVRSEGDATRCGDGLLELSAGTRVSEGVRGCAIDAATLARLRARYRHNRYAAHVGTLADHLRGSLNAVGPAATALLTNSAGTPPSARASLSDAIAAAPTGVFAVVDDQLYGPKDRASARKALNSTITDQFRDIAPLGATVVIAGISDGVNGGPHLHPLLIAGGGLPHRELTSATTGRAPFVQLIDLTATLIKLHGDGTTPAVISGRPVRATDRRVPVTSSYVDLDRHARAALHVGHPTMTGLCIALLVPLLFALAGRAEAKWPARLLLLAPLAPALLQFVPWWRWGTGAYAALVVGIGVVGAVAVTLVDRRSPRLALLAGPAVIAAVLLADQVSGSHLQLASPLGDNPLVAGRFHGMGNIDFGLTMACVLLVAAVVATGRRARRGSVAVAAGLCVLAVVIDGLPRFGDDIGGVVALLPAAALLVALVAGVRVTIPRLVVVIGAAIAAGLGVALLDYARPAARQTHAGRFVGQVLHGGAWRVVHRKLDAVLASFTNPVVTAAVIVAVIAAIVLYRRFAPPRGIAIAVVCVGVLAVLGTVLNDSGVFVAAAALLGLVPAVLATALPDSREGDTGAL
jgi:hypothetical protein